jgi:hypothetical protein
MRPAAKSREKLAVERPHMGAASRRGTSNGGIWAGAGEKVLGGGAGAVEVRSGSGRAVWAHPGRGRICVVMDSPIVGL